MNYQSLGPLEHVGATYNCGAYGVDRFQDGQCAQAGVPNTGYAPADAPAVSSSSIVYLTVGCILLAVAVTWLIVIFWGRRRPRS